MKTSKQQPTREDLRKILDLAGFTVRPVGDSTVTDGTVYFYPVSGYSDGIHVANPELSSSVQVAHKIAAVLENHQINVRVKYSSVMVRWIRNTTVTA